MATAPSGSGGRNSVRRSTGASELTALVRDGIYRAGFDAIRKMFGAGGGGAARPAAPPPRTVSMPMKPIQSAMPLVTSMRAQVGTTHAIVIEHYGGPEVLEFKEIGLPALRPGEVLIRHTAIGVNFIDVYCRTGHFDLLTPPGVLGMEAAGIVRLSGRAFPISPSVTASSTHAHRSELMRNAV